MNSLLDGSDSTAIFPPYLTGSGALRLLEGQESLAMPDWCESLCRIGWWARHYRSPGRQLVVVCRLVSPVLASAFAALGAVMGGAAEQKGVLTWESLLAMPAGTRLFWRFPGESRRFEGEVAPPDPQYGDLVQIKVTAGPKKWAGAAWTFNREKLARCVFSDVQVPTRHQVSTAATLALLLESIKAPTSYGWLSTGGLEAALITDKNGFRRSLDGVSVGAHAAPTLRLEDMLLTGKDGTEKASKLHLAPHGFENLPAAPVYLLDGRRALRRIGELGSGNIVVLLSRAEYSEQVHGKVRQFYTFSEALVPIPWPVASGLDVVAYAARTEVVDR